LDEFEKVLTGGGAKGEFGVHLLLDFTRELFYIELLFKLIGGIFEVSL
jgi:hypothetical protein